MWRVLLLTLIIASPATAASYPYYPGTYNPTGSSPTNAAPANSDQAPPPAPNPPPVIYRRVPVYRAVPASRAPEWASPADAALGPWPWNFDFGGGPTAVAGSRGGLVGGTNFEFGGGYNFNPNAGFVLEFMNSWLGVTDHLLRQNGAIDGSAGVYSITLNPIWRFRIGGPIGGYLIGGGGYYQRETRLDEPVTFFVPTFRGGFLETDVQTVRQYDDAGGLNVGAGLTWNWGWGTKFFIEARYHYLFTSGTPTQIIPITFGFRW